MSVSYRNVRTGSDAQRSVQDHILDKYNGETRPDYRDKYCYGDSIPVPKNELKQTLKAKLQDIWKKGGKGPICMLSVFSVVNIRYHIADITQS